MVDNIFKDIKIFQNPELDELERLAELEPEQSEEIIDEIPTDEPEEISAEEAASEVSVESETPTANIFAPDEPEENHIASLVCEVCLELNLTQHSVIKCARCEKAFCFHFSSNIDAEYCVNCMSDITVTKQVITKTYEHKDAETGATTFYRRKAREIKIDGLDWLFAQRKVNTMSDTELDMAIEYHRNICSLIMQESERRRNEKMHRYAGVKIILPKTDGTSSTTTTTVKKTRVVSKDKATELLMAQVKAMMAKGFTAEKLAAMLKK
jgi:hypothetical protein